MAKQIFKLIVECVKLLLIAAALVLGTVGAVDFIKGNDYGESEPTKPLSPEQCAENEALYAQMAADLAEINN